jgi:Tfp pilus assembly protein PilX
MSKPTNPRHGERGSAYIVVLLALVVLTIVGLSLVMVTQTEVQLGSNERTIARTFFSGDSGISVAPVRQLLSQHADAFTFIVNETQVGNERIADQVKLSDFNLIGSGPCDGCGVNANDAQYLNTNHVLSVTSNRVSWEGPGLPPVNANVLSQSQVVSEVRITNEQVGSNDPLRPPP